MKTYSLKASEIKKAWHLIDAEGLVLGRLATIISGRLRGKHKPEYTPHLDCGDNIIVINAEKVCLTGNKMEDKVFYWHTGHPGGIKQRTMKETLRGKKPEALVLDAVRRMITRGPLGRRQMENLYVYAGPDHPHAGQKPEILDVASMNPKNKRMS